MSSLSAPFWMMTSGPSAGPKGDGFSVGAGGAEGSGSPVSRTLPVNAANLEGGVAGGPSFDETLVWVPASGGVSSVPRVGPPGASIALSDRAVLGSLSAGPECRTVASPGSGERPDDVACVSVVDSPVRVCPALRSFFRQQLPHPDPPQHGKQLKQPTPSQH